MSFFEGLHADITKGRRIGNLATRALLALLAAWERVRRMRGR